MRTFLVVAAATGIGQALTKLLVQEGHRVIGTVNTTPSTFNHPNVSYHTLDVLSPEIDFSFIPPTLDGLVYTPGAINLRPFKRIKPAAFLDYFNLQVVGAIKVIQAGLESLKKGENPSIVLFSTVAVQRGYNFHSQVAASKGAVEGLVRSLAAELAPSIRVNAVAPSITNTPLAQKLLNTEQKVEGNGLKHPLKRVGEAIDSAAAAHFLLSNQASWITGQVLGVDGGISKVNAQ